MNINLHNYESCFHLYVDGELDAEQMAAVEAFAAQYPHLGEVLEQLMQTVMPAPSLSMPNKSKLLRPEPWDADNLTEAQVHLLNRLEAGELAGADDRESVLLRRTLLQPEPMMMPGKNKLYRQADSRRPATILNLSLLKRLAAAAAIVAAAWALWPQGNQSNTPAPDVTVADPAISVAQPPIADSGLAAAGATAPTDSAAQPKNLNPAPPATNRLAPDVAVTPSPMQQSAQEVSVAYQTPVITTPPLPQSGSLTAEPLVAVADPVQPAENPITEDAIETTMDAMPNDADITEEEYVNIGGVKFKKSRFRGLVRSVSRNISRRTSSEQLQQAIMPR